MSRLARLLLLSTLLGLSACVTHSGKGGDNDWPDAAGFQFFVREGVRYTPPRWPEELLADVYVPKTLGALPAVLLVHGGDWTDGERGDMSLIAKRLAQAGFVVVNVDYRLAPAHPFPAALQDLHEAVRWMRSNAAVYQIDPARIGAWGYEAGGQLVALLGSVDEQLRPGSRSPAQLGAVVLGGTPYDLLNWDEKEIVATALGTAPGQQPERARQASPIQQVNATTPPTLLYHAGMDRYIPAAQAEGMKAVLERNKIPAELFIVHGLGHSTMFLVNRQAIGVGTDFLNRRLRGW